MKNKFNKKISLVFSICLIFLLVFPTVVFAEGEEPVDGGEVTTEYTEATTEVVVVEETIAIEVPDQEPDLADVVEDLNQAEIVIVDETGDSLPLVSEEAVEVLTTLDPIGCPVGVTPIWMGGTGIGCTVNYTSIQAAIDDVMVVDGWTIYIQSGTYTENVKLYKSITLYGEDRDTTIIQPTSGPGIYVRADGTVIKNLTIDTSLWAIDFDGGSGYLPDVVKAGIDDTLIENVSLTNNPKEGVYIGNGAQVTNIEIKDSSLNNNLNGVGVSGSTTSVDGLVITNSRMENNTNHGVQIMSNVQVGTVEITDSVLSLNKLQGLNIQAGANVSYLAIKNSEVMNNKGSGLAVNTATVGTFYLEETLVNANTGHNLYLYKANITNLNSIGSSFSNAVTWEGVHLEGSTIGTASFADGTIVNNKGQGLLTKLTTIGTLSIGGNSINGNGATGLLLTGTINELLDIDRNYFSGNGWEDLDLGVSWIGPLSILGQTKISGNTFSGGAWNAIWIDTVSNFNSTPIINYNLLNGPNWAIVNLGNKIIDAKYNYWGCSGGVGTTGCKQVAGPGWGASTNTDTSPWLIDADGDGIFISSDSTKGWGWDTYLGYFDNCPNDYNPDQLDSDNDGVGDVCDPFPYAADSKDDCKNGMWEYYVREDGTAFTNQGDCIQYVNTDK